MASHLTVEEVKVLHDTLKAAQDKIDEAYQIISELLEPPEKLSDLGFAKGHVLKVGDMLDFISGNYHFSLRPVLPCLDPSNDAEVQLIWKKALSRADMDLSHGEYRKGMMGTFKLMSLEEKMKLIAGLVKAL